MTRDRLHRDNAARQKAYRQRLKHNNGVTRRTREETLFDKACKGEVVVYDGEGITSAEGHLYTSLSALGPDDTYLEITNSGARLSTEDIFAFLLQCKKVWPNVLHIGFALSYDTIHWLHDLPLPLLKRALSDDRCGSEYKGYMCSYRPRHEFWLSRDKLSMTVWDIFGFFQCSLLTAIDRWQVDMGDWKALIERGKAARGSFDGWTAADIADYTRAELFATRRLFGRLCRAVGYEGIRLNRYDGAGAIASALLRGQGYTRKEFEPMVPRTAGKAETVLLNDAIDRAYFGGRIEALKIGHHNAPVYSYDICSAYPAIIAQLPHLTHGHWTHELAQFDASDLEGAVALDPPFTLYRVSWSFPAQYDSMPLPFPYRWGNSVYYPPEGQCWIWKPLLDVYRANMGIFASPLTRVTVHERYSFTPTTAQRPFAFVSDVYQHRQQLINEKPAGWGGREKAIKLGINSIYGKFCQRHGALTRTGCRQRPTYYNRAYAGFITASTQAALLSAAYTDPEAVISLQTDGIFATRPLDLALTHSKELGLWEANIYDALLMVYSGLYYTQHAGSWAEKSRGLEHAKSPAEIERRIAMILDAWRHHKTWVSFPARRFYGPRLSASSGAAYSNRGVFWEGRRDIDLTGGNGKRQAVAKDTAKAAEELIITYARGGDYGWGFMLSHPAAYGGYDAETLEELEDARDEWEGI